MPIHAVPHIVAIGSDDSKYDGEHWPLALSVQQQQRQQQQQGEESTTAAANTQDENNTEQQQEEAASLMTTERAILHFHRALEQDPQRKIIKDMSVRLAALVDAASAPIIHALRLALAGCTVRYLNLWWWGGSSTTLLSDDHTVRLAMTALCRELASNTTHHLDLELLPEPLLRGVLDGLARSKHASSPLKLECTFDSLNRHRHVVNHPHPHHNDNNNNNNHDNDRALHRIADYCTVADDGGDGDKKKSVQELVLNLPRVTVRTWQSLLSLLRSHNKNNNTIKDLTINPAGGATVTQQEEQDEAAEAEEHDGIHLVDTEEPTEEILQAWQAAVAANTNLEELTISFDIPRALLAALCRGLCHNKNLLHLKLHLSIKNVRLLMEFLPQFAGLRSLNLVVSHKPRAAALSEALEKEELLNLISTALGKNTSLLCFECKGLVADFDDDDDDAIVTQNQGYFSKRNLALIMMDAARGPIGSSSSSNRGTISMTRATLGRYFGKLAGEHAHVATTPFYTMLQQWYIPQSLGRMDRRRPTSRKSLREEESDLTSGRTSASKMRRLK